METNKYTSSKEENYAKAKRKVERIKGFYRHLIVFLGFNIVLILLKMMGVIGEEKPFLSALTDIQALFTWIPWGIGLAIHGIVVFEVFTFFVGKDWEEQKIKKILQKENNDTQD